MQDNKDGITMRGHEISQSFRVGQRTISVLKNINFTIKRNTFTVIFGPSGSGKSTLLNILTGLQPPTTGKVYFDGKSLYELHPDELAHFRASTVGFVYQQNYWVASLDVMENVATPLYFLGISRLKANQQARKSLDIVGMGKYAKLNPSLLSSGEQQRVAMARAIIGQPELIVADEPTGSLDTTNGDKIMELLRHSQEDLHKTVILVSHNMEYLPLADNLLHIQDGRLKQMPTSSMAKTTDDLLAYTRSRIDTLAKVKRGGASHEK